MDVVTRKEFCEDFHNRENGDKAEVRLADVPIGTVFRAAIGVFSANPLHVWLKTAEGTAVCVGEPTKSLKVGYFNFGDRKNPTVRDYEELNATIVIDE